jgi:hypothetical protein
MGIRRDVGIFSFLGKKDRQPDAPESDKDASRKKSSADSSRLDTPKPAPRSNNSQIVQRDAARATAKKIDAIESEMTSELIRPVQKAAPKTVAPPPAKHPAAPPPAAQKSAPGKPAQAAKSVS